MKWAHLGQKQCNYKTYGEIWNHKLHTPGSGKGMVKREQKLCLFLALVTTDSILGSCTGAVLKHQNDLVTNETCVR